MKNLSKNDRREISRTCTDGSRMIGRGTTLTMVGGSLSVVVFASGPRQRICSSSGRDRKCFLRGWTQLGVVGGGWRFLDGQLSLQYHLELLDRLDSLEVSLAKNCSFFTSGLRNSKRLSKNTYNSFVTKMVCLIRFTF